MCPVMLRGGLGFPLVRNGGQAGGGAPCSVGCLNMGVFDREEMEVVVRAPLFGEFGHKRVCGTVVFVRVDEGEVAWGSAKDPGGVGILHAGVYEEKSDHVVTRNTEIGEMVDG